MMLWMRDQENIERGVEQGMKKQRCSIITRMILQSFLDEQIKGACGTSGEEIAECRAIIQEKEMRK